VTDSFTVIVFAVAVHSLTTSPFVY